MKNWKSSINNIIVKNVEELELTETKQLKNIFVVDLPINNDEKSKVLEKLTSLNKATSWEIEELELILSEPQPEPKTHTSSFDNIYNHVDNFHNISVKASEIF